MSTATQETKFVSGKQTEPNSDFSAITADQSETQSAEKSQSSQSNIASLTEADEVQAEPKAEDLAKKVVELTIRNNFLEQESKKKDQNIKLLTEKVLALEAKLNQQQTELPDLLKKLSFSQNTITSMGQHIQKLRDSEQEHHLEFEKRLEVEKDKVKKQLDYIQTLVAKINTTQEVASAIEKFKSDQTNLPSFLWEAGSLAKPSTSPFTCSQVASDVEKADKLINILKEYTTFDDFMSMGNDLSNPKYGQRYLKYSPDVVIGSLKGKYWGEWSQSTNKPHGKGIFINENGSIQIGIYNNGAEADGRYLQIFPGGVFLVGSQKTIAGNPTYKSTVVKPDGTIIEISNQV